MKKILSLVLAIGILVQGVGTYAAMMYALDGRTLWVNDNEIEAYRQVNWYYGKPVTMYSLDGRTLTVGENDVEMYRQVGWYYGKPVTMYSLDGRTLTIGENDIEMYRKVGWYLTRPDTKAKVVGHWFNENTDPYMEHFSEHVYFYDDGTYLDSTWREKRVGTYTMNGDTVTVKYDFYFNYAGSTEYYYEWSGTKYFKLINGRLVLQKDVLASGSVYYDKKTYVFMGAPDVAVGEFCRNIY